MGKTLKNIGFVLAVLVISFGIYWLLYVDRQSKGEALEYAMHLLGDDLMAMVPDGPAKDAVQQRFDEFTSDANEGHLSAEEVQMVSANILNLKNTASTITPDQAEAVLDLSLRTPMRIGRGEVEDKDKKSSERLSKKERERLGKRIESLHDISERLRVTVWDSLKEKEKSCCTRFRIAEDLKLAIDAELEDELLQSELKELTTELKALEKEKLIEWRQDFDEDFRKEMEDMEREMEKLKAFTEKELAEDLKEMNLELLEELKNIVPPDIPFVNSDSINALVQEGLKKAGLLKADLTMNEAKIDSIHQAAHAAAMIGLKVMHKSLASLDSLDFVPVIINADSIRAEVERSLREAGIGD